MSKIIVMLQSEAGAINRVSLEALGAARELAASGGGTVHALLFGDQADISSISSSGIDEIMTVPAAELSGYSSDFYVVAAAAIIDSESPAIFVTGHTYQARDWMPRLAARLNRPLLSDCIGFVIDDTTTWVRPVFQGKISGNYKTTDGLVLVSVQSGAFRSDDLGSGSPTTRQVDVDLSNVTSKVTREAKFQEAKGSVDLSRAERIVSVGRGVGEEDNLPIIRELAAALNAEIGSSRPVVDYGWLDHDRQVGSSGQTVSPKVYFAIGISGAIQHQVGMKNSGCIVAINKDANAPIFEIADYGIVGDLNEIVPALTKALTEG